MWVARVVLVLLLIVSGCSGSDTEATGEETSTTVIVEAPTTTTATPTTKSEAEPTTSTAEVEPPPVAEARTLTFNGIERAYLLYVPGGVQPDTPAPLILAFHGLGESADRLSNGSGFNALAEREGVIVAYPYALAGDELVPMPSWSFLDTTDVEFAQAVIADIETGLTVDRNRLYAMGFSQGANFSTFLACKDPDTYAAVASVAGFNHHDPAFCPTTVPANIVAFLGTNDPFVTIEEGLTADVPESDPPGPLAEEVALWTETNNCEPEPSEQAAGDSATRLDYECVDGQIVIYLHDGEHVWPGPETEGIDTNTLIWQFLSTHTNSE